MSGMSNFSRRSSLTVDGQSLLGAVNRFVQAVDAMDDTVMIPCRLRDIPVDSSVSIPSVREENNNNKALIPVLQLNGDLYQFYVMLHAIKSEIITGPNPEEEIQNSNIVSSSIDEKINGSDPVNENARKTAASFRFHLRGLFGVLHQMTETANFLSSRYEREITSQNGVSSVSSFNM
ncbi:unnamed protein product [Candidula unifasciata]|uniref:Mid1-interacting protein n=1 Tax=Candidula unifasciata TaxID=100452 RepID=A0A8S3ZCX6_9EUPU|nr:unnamed protein product [Candidula unifasciata]